MQQQQQQQLSQWLAQGPSIAVISGCSGVGKTLLISNLQQQHRHRYRIVTIDMEEEEKKKDEDDDECSTTSSSSSPSSLQLMQSLMHGQTDLQGVPLCIVMDNANDYFEELITKLRTVESSMTTTTKIIIVYRGVIGDGGEGNNRHHLLIGQDASVVHIVMPQPRTHELIAIIARALSQGGVPNVDSDLVTDIAQQASGDFRKCAILIDTVIRAHRASVPLTCITNDTLVRQAATLFALPTLQQQLDHQQQQQTTTTASPLPLPSTPLLDSVVHANYLRFCPGDIFAAASTARLLSLDAGGVETLQAARVGKLCGKTTLVYPKPHSSERRTAMLEMMYKAEATTRQRWTRRSLALELCPLIFDANTCTRAETSPATAQRLNDLWRLYGVTDALPREKMQEIVRASNAHMLPVPVYSAQTFNSVTSATRITEMTARVAAFASELGISASLGMRMRDELAADYQGLIPIIQIHRQQQQQQSQPLPQPPAQPSSSSTQDLSPPPPAPPLPVTMLSKMPAYSPPVKKSPVKRRKIDNNNGQTLNAFFVAKK